MTGFLNPLRNIHDGDWLKITRPDYSVIYVKIEDTNDDTEVAEDEQSSETTKPKAKRGRKKTVKAEVEEVVESDK